MSFYTEEEYQEIKEKYGKYASWAIWNENDMGDLEVIEDNIDQLHSKYVFLALNMSKSVKTWSNWENFHGGSPHDRKLMYALNRTKLRGSYLTDLFKGIPQKDSNKFEENLTESDIKQNVKFFKEEMKDIKLKPHSTFVILGKTNTYNLFKEHFKPHFENKAVPYYHYSYYGLSDEEWVKELWKKLGIDEEYSQIHESFKS